MKIIQPILLVAMLTALSAGAHTPSTTAQDDKINSIAWSYLLPLTDETTGIGARPAGSKSEKQAAEWITKKWQQQGYAVQELGFKYNLGKQAFRSQNLVVDIKGKSEKTLVVGAHYDSTGHKAGSLGATDNASGVAAMLALSSQLKNQSLPFSVRLIAFGAEEVGLQGARAYVKDQLSDKQQLIGMINLDTIIGGDNLYVHSAHTTAYKCKGLPNSKYNSETSLRDGLVSVSKALFGSQHHRLHPAYNGYPEGVTGSWSDHSPFACSDMPIAYLEATNFAIDGKDGNDGYSQTTSSELWDCYDDKNNTACDRKKEKSWGMIWHTKFDRLDTLEPVMPKRLAGQLQQNVDVLTQFVLTADKYLN